MKYIYSLLSLLLLALFSVTAQDEVRERVFVHTDKETYVAGEDIWVKFYSVDQDFNPSKLSKVGYIEISDTIRPQLQVKLALDQGSGWGKISIPASLSSGIYQLSAYTRFMRNESESVFFNKQIAVINVNKPSERSRFEVVDSMEVFNWQEKASGIRINTSKAEYSNREQVGLTIDNLPDNIGDLVVSVSRKESMVSFDPITSKQSWIDGVKQAKTSPFRKEWLPEYEGHILHGKFVPEVNSNNVVCCIGFVGDDIRYISGQIKDDKINFYTSGIYGPQQIVSTLISKTNAELGTRINILSPFCESTPQHLPLLQVMADKERLMEWSIGSQIQEIVGNDTILVSVEDDYYHIEPYLKYNLDEFTRFETLEETIFEFIRAVRVSKMGGEKTIRVFLKSEERFNSGNTLVLLDGVPIFDHSEILAYNPHYIQYMNIYVGRYFFGGTTFECIVSFTSHTKDLPFFQLNDNSQLVSYDCPMLPTHMIQADYSTRKKKESRMPDFRHTLYWNPSIQTTDRSAQLNFFTSDLNGEFQVTVEGFTLDGKPIHGTSSFIVK